MGAWIRRLGLGAIAVGAVALVAVAVLFNAFERAGPLTGNALVVVPKGAGLKTITELLHKHGIIESKFVFKTGVRLTGRQSRLQAGEYSFPAAINARAVADLLVSGKTVVRKLTLPEGATVSQALIILRAAYGLAGPVVRVPAEGALLPDTYHYSYGDLRADLIARMETAMVQEVAYLWGRRAKGLPFKAPHEAIILASIVERETAVAAERPMVAGVFLNRLQRKMPLQSDPTVAYGIAYDKAMPGRILNRPLTRADLKKPGVYNTYLNRGLPPEAISNPGRESIHAVLHPARTEALYFVADGKGGHAFAASLKEHNQNVRRWREIRDAARKAVTEAEKKKSPEAAPKP